MSGDMKIIRMEEKHLPKVVEVGSKCFSGLKDPEKAKQWIECNFKGYPRMQYFVAEEGENILGYILWMEKGGFRPESVWELEQIGVHPDHQGKGVGSKLINESLPEIRTHIKDRGAKLKLIEVTTGTENEAQRLYNKTLGAKPEATLKQFFRSDELVMFARFEHEWEKENKTEDTSK